jgi:hypothetical protein
MKTLLQFQSVASRAFMMFIAILLTTNLMAQVAINEDSGLPDGSAMLDVKSTDKGMLIPRMTEAQRDAIASPATGLLIFQTNYTKGYYYFDGTDWKVVGSGAFSIDDLSDGKIVGNSIFLGEAAGANASGSGLDYRNVAVGDSTLYLNLWGLNNTAVGCLALYSNNSGVSNNAIGAGALYSNMSGNGNVANGNDALRNNIGGSYNTVIGNNASKANTTGNYNVTIGSAADYRNQEGSNNTVIGFEAGMGTALNNKSGNIFLGFKAGYNETGDNKLYIENSNSATPLIYGEFDNDILTVNGKLGIGVTSPTSKLHIDATSGENGLRVLINGSTKLKVSPNGSVVVGYNASSPTYALQLQNNSSNLLGRGLAYSWTTYSDGRLKTDQKTLDYGLKEVMQLQPKSYDHHSSETLEDGTFIMVGSQKTHTFGFIAQELNKVIPEAVYVPEDESKTLWAIDYEKLIPVLTKAMQEQQEIIENMQKENAELKEQMEKQNSQMIEVLKYIRK